MAFNYEYPYTDPKQYNDDWLLNKMKELIADWGEFHDNISMEWDETKNEWTLTKTAWNDLKEFVETFFENLDVQDEVNTKLNGLVADGTMSNLLAPFIQGQSAPIVVATTAAMTDQSKLYVHSPDGHMYAYRDGAWRDTGIVYGELDQLTQLSEDLTNLENNKVDSMYNAFTEYEEVAGSVRTYGQFISRYGGEVTAYDNYNTVTCNCSVGETLYIKIRLRGDVTPLGICVKNANGDIVQRDLAGANVDYTNNYYTFIVTASDANNITVSSFLTDATVFTETVNTNKLKSVYEYGAATIDGYKPRIDIVLNSGKHNKLGYIDGGACIFTCDDGMLTDKTYIMPLIDEFNIPFVFGLWNNSEIINSASELSAFLPYVTNKGCEVAQHDHMTAVGRTLQANYDRFTAQRDLMNAKGLNVKNMIFPYNDYDTPLLQCCYALYDYACGGGNKNNSTRTNSYELNRVWISSGVNYQFCINKAISENGLIIFGIHSGELADSAKMAVMRGAIQYAKSSGIHITTLSGLNSL